MVGSNVPRITVIIPAFNRARVLPRAIDSVLAQDLGDFELIVVDDGSSDGSAGVARGYGDRRIQVIELGRNCGANAARNAGIRAATAPLLAFLDSDDSYLPHKLSTVAAEFDARPELEVLVDSFVKMCCPEDKRARVERRNRRITSKAEFARCLFNRELWKPTSAISCRREAAIRAGLFDESVSRRQDMDFLIRLTDVATCASTDEILWVKGWSADGISAGDKFVASTLAIVRAHPQYLDTPDYRVGVARDLTRHVLLLMKERRYAQARADLRLMIDDLGAGQIGALFALGAKELAGRSLKPRRGSPVDAISPGLAKARRSASARS
jgi:glycosyltransferase involved in cell wall biosynthesis